MFSLRLCPRTACLRVGTFDVCVARPKVCPTDIVRPHSAQLMIDTSVNQNMAHSYCIPLITYSHHSSD